MLSICRNNMVSKSLVWSAIQSSEVQLSRENIWALGWLQFKEPLLQTVMVAGRRRHDESWLIVTWSLILHISASNRLLRTSFCPPSYNVWLTHKQKNWRQKCLVRWQHFVIGNVNKFCHARNKYCISNVWSLILSWLKTFNDSWFWKSYLDIETTFSSPVYKSHRRQVA